MGEENIIIIIIKYEEQLLYSLNEFYFRLKHTQAGVKHCVVMKVSPCDTPDVD